VIFGEGIEADALTLIRDGSDFIFRIDDANQITFKDWFLGGDRYIETFRFADGTTWNLDTVRNHVAEDNLGTRGDDTLTGWEGRDTLRGLDGDDVLNGGQPA
jgi:Ca2+-binding RTX toxin-like protein